MYPQRQSDFGDEMVGFVFKALLLWLWLAVVGIWTVCLWLSKWLNRLVII